MEAFDADVLEHAAVARDSLFHVVVALPLDGGPQLALVYRLFDERPRVVVVLAVAAKGQRDL